MKKYILLIISAIGLSSAVFAQSTIDGVLVEIEKNNTALSAMKKTGEAEKFGNKTGIYLQNPEVEFNYLWGSPSVLGNRTDFGIKQSFDFPTVYKFKNQISNIKNEQVELEYRKQLKTILLQTRLICSDLIYTNALKSELSKRLIHAQSIANAYKSKFDIGEANILEYNKAQLNALNIGNKLESIEIERKVLLSELAGLNGGIFIEFMENKFPTQTLSADFEQWFSITEESNPVLKWLKQEVEISQKEEQLSKAQSLPKIQTGYMSEKVIGEQFQGISLGISVPLWENKNTLKYAHAKTIAVQSTMDDHKIQFFNRLKAKHFKAMELQKNADDYRAKLHLFDSSDLLKKALEKGEISLIDYILELAFYYESVNKLLDLDKELNKTIAELNQYI